MKLSLTEKAQGGDIAAVTIMGSAGRASILDQQRESR